MTTAYYDGAQAFADKWSEGLRPDPPLWVNEWADAHMRIPKENGAEPGKYNSARTPYAVEVMRVLSPEHPARRVVAKVASQMMKTQVALNWIGASIDCAPGNFLTLLPSLSLAKRVSGRIDKAFKAVGRLDSKLAPARSRDARNTIDTKEFQGGTLYITTAGSASNLAEVPARYIYGDEVDRWERNVDKEGDPIELAETRTTTFGRNAKIYYTSSPTLEGASLISDLYDQSDKRVFLVPCPHCGAEQELQWERLKYDESCEDVYYVCENDCVIFENEKENMLPAGRWVATAIGDGETIGFTINALYMPLGWRSWKDLAKQYLKALAALSKGDSEPMQVFYNTRLARCWSNKAERTSADELEARKEPYSLRTLDDQILILTAAIDVQGDRLELKIVGWGRGLESWIVDYIVINGDPAKDEVWKKADEILLTPIRRKNGRDMKIAACCVDSGDGNRLEEVLKFVRNKRYRNVVAIKGASRPNKPVISSRPQKSDFNKQGKQQLLGVEVYQIGTDTAKDWIAARLKWTSGPGAIHFSGDLGRDYFEQLTAEYKVVKYVKGYRKTVWDKPKGARNEALDLMVYNLAAAHLLGMHRWKDADWDREQRKVDPDQRDIFDDDGAFVPIQNENETPVPEQPQAPPQIRQQPSVTTQADPADDAGFVVYEATTL